MSKDMKGVREGRRRRKFVGRVERARRKALWIERTSEGWAQQGGPDGWSGVTNGGRGRREGLLKWLSGKESACQYRRRRFGPWVGKIPWERKWQPTPVFLPGESHGLRRLAGDSPWGHKESGTT